jgi:hypothetical protein
MMLLNAIYVSIANWIGGESKRKSIKFADWMPGDWSEDLHQEPAGDVVENLDNFVRATSR